MQSGILPQVGKGHSPPCLKALQEAAKEKGCSYRAALDFQPRPRVLDRCLSVTLPSDKKHEKEQGCGTALGWARASSRVWNSFFG